MNNHPKSEVGKPCPHCKQPIVLYEYHDMEAYTGCSEFCATTSDKELQEFLTAKSGDYEVFPCSVCGCPVEGEWEPENRKQQMCSDCYHKVRAKERTALLKQAQTLLMEVKQEVSAEAQLKVGVSVHTLLKQIQEALEF